MHEFNRFSRPYQPVKRTPLVAGITSFPRQLIIGLLLIVALFAFELFNFDTTQFALDSLLAGTAFAGIGWATILAFAFCAIDFAGLAHLFTPNNLRNERKEVYFLMGAWLLGATMNALMTWWTVTLILVQHPLTGNDVLTHAQLLKIVPIFVAGLVWLTRILFIGGISIAGEQLFWYEGQQDTQRAGNRTMPTRPKRDLPNRQPKRAPAPRRPTVQRQPAWAKSTTDELPSFIHNRPNRRSMDSVGYVAKRR